MSRFWFVLALMGLTRCACDEDSSGASDGAAADGPMSLDGATVDDDVGLGDAASAVTSLELTPASSTLTTDGVTPARVTYHVVAHRADGSTEDVTSTSLFSTMPSLGTFSGAELSTTDAGETVVRATYQGVSADASLRVVLQALVLVPVAGSDPLPNNPSTVVSGAPLDPARAPAVVYPNDGVLIPNNLGALELHFLPGAGNSLFEVALESPFVSVRIYTRCNPLANGCLLTLDGDVFRGVAMASRGAPALQLVVRGADDAGSGVGASAPLSISFSARPVQGGLYYWTTSNGTAIMRVDFGELTRPPERFFPFAGDSACYGCHALSPNGERMTLSHAGQWQGQLTLLEVGSGQIALTRSDDHREQFQTWAPASDRFAGVFGDGDPPDTNIRIRDGRTGLVIESIPIGNEVTHPDWSPRGDRIAFTWVTHHETSQRPGRGGLGVVKYQAGRWSGPEMVLAPIDGKNRYTPAHSPDGRFLVYAESTCPQGSTYEASCDGDADPSSRIFAVTSSLASPIELSRVNAPGAADHGATDLSNTFPKWAPFVDERFRDGSGSVTWITISSRRAYGLRQGGGDQWLWMAAVDPEAVMAGRDGSYAAFALPFQDFSTSNHMAQWAARFVPTQPTDGGPDPGNDGDGSTGSDGGPDPGNQGDGGECLVVGDPCDPASDRCCTGAACRSNGPGVFICRPDL